MIFKGGVGFLIALSGEILFINCLKATRGFSIFTWGLSFRHCINFLWVGLTTGDWPISEVIFSSIIISSSSFTTFKKPGTQKDGRLIVCVYLCMHARARVPTINWSSWNEIKRALLYMYLHILPISLAQMRFYIFVPKERNCGHRHHHFGYYLLCSY